MPRLSQYQHELEQAAKTPRIKLSNPKTPATESSSKKRAAKPKPTTKKTAAKVLGSDDEMLDTPIAQEKPLTPAEAMEKKEKESKELIPMLRFLC